MGRSPNKRQRRLATQPLSKGGRMKPSRAFGLRMGLFVVAVAMGTLVAGTSAQAAGPPVTTVAWSQGGTTITSYDYKTLDAGAGQTKPVTFTLTNSGGRASGTLVVTLSGPTVFTVTADGCTGRSLGPNNSCDVTVQYAPTTSEENDSATLTATGEHVSATSITLTGKSGTPNLKLSLPATFTGTDSNGTNHYSYWFGQVNSGTFVTLPFTVTNKGDGTANTGQLAGLVTGFTLSNDQTSNQNLAPLKTSTFDLTFSPSCTGPMQFSMTLAVPSRTAAAPPYISAAYTAECVVPPITSVTASLTSPNPQSLSSGTGQLLQGILKNVNFTPTSPPSTFPGGHLHGFTIQIPFTLPPGRTLNCDASMINSYSAGYPGSTCSVSGNVLTVTQNWLPSFSFVNWGPGFSKQIGYVQVGSDGLNETIVVWGTPTVTAVH